MDTGLTPVALGKVEELRIPRLLTVLPAADGHGFHVFVKDALRAASDRGSQLNPNTSIGTVDRRDSFLQTRAPLSALNRYRREVQSALKFVR